MRNYRSHPEILSVPNSLIYEDELVASADQSTAYNLTEWEHLPCRGVPSIFLGIQGLDQREGNSPSWFNSDKASVVLDYIQKLSEYGIKSEDIGVISPYNEQK